MNLRGNTLNSKPTIIELGPDLLNLSKAQLLLTLGLPFLFFLLYFTFAFLEFWTLAVLCTMALSFTTYGSTSHDLVHENLKINKKLNTVLLSFTEVICFRSGHAYRLSHLYHHKRYPHQDDIEGAASRMTLVRTLIEGVIFQFKIYRWSLSPVTNRKFRTLILFEGIAITILSLFCIISLLYSFVPFIYLCLMICGSWIIPLITSYAVHTPEGENDLHQTRLFRGKFFSLIAFDHLYHLEHHLYPMVPHKNWPKLADRLDNYFISNGVTPVELNIIQKSISSNG